MGFKVPSADVEVLVEAFKVFDREGKGKISRDRLLEVFSSLGTETFRPPSETELDELMKEADANGDGEIDCEEFVKLMIQKQTL